MPYCEGRLFHHAGSHFMETPDRLSRHVDPAFRRDIPPMQFDLIGDLGNAVGGIGSNGAHSPEGVAELAMDIMAKQGYEALGASNPPERIPVRSWCVA